MTMSGVKVSKAALAGALALATIGCAHPAEAQGLRDKAAAASAEQTMRVGGVERSYLLHDFSKGKAAPVVIALHGGGGDPENAVRMTQFDRIGAREGLIVVYPGGTSRNARGKLLTWNAGHCCAYAMENGIDDVGFISALIDSLVASGKADPRRIYVTGMSNGGMMSHRLGRELSTRIAAIAPVVGAVFGDEPAPVAPVPAFIIVGAEDQVVPGAGGPLQLRGILGNRSAADRDVAPAIDQATYWAKANGCGASKVSETPAARVTEWSGCTADVVFTVVAGNGHAWPGGRAGREGAAEPSQAYDASEQMWAFFKAHPRP